MKKLFVCSEFYAGLLPFAATIVNTMRNENSYGVFVCTTKCDYRKALVPNGNNYMFLDFPESKLKGLFHNLYPGRVLKAISKVCRENEIDIIHLLTEDSSLAFHLKKLKKLAKVYYTVHDLFFHEKVYENILSWFLRTALVKVRVTYLINRTENLVTCSKYQYNWMRANFLNKHIYYHNFPTLITETVKLGDAVAPELNGIYDYILFFGQIEQYKGVDILYNAFVNDNSNVNKRRLVIAGKGHIYFQRDLKKEDCVIFINRYINDDEIKNLFNRAFCVVFPYISGTQSGILSLPYYFKTPSVVSNIAFFRELIIDNVTSISFDNQNPASLIQKINAIDEGNRAKLINEAFRFYTQIYDHYALRDQLSATYADNFSLHQQLL